MGKRKYKKGAISSIEWWNDLLYRVFQSQETENGKAFMQLIVPVGYRETMLKLATQKSADKILTQFFWPGIQADVRRFCASCDICQRTFPKGKNTKVPPPTTAFLRWANLKERNCIAISRQVVVGGGGRAVNSAGGATQNSTALVAVFRKRPKYPQPISFNFQRKFRWTTVPLSGRTVCSQLQQTKAQTFMTQETSCFKNNKTVNFLCS